MDRKSKIIKLALVLIVFTSLTVCVTRPWKTKTSESKESKVETSTEAVTEHSDSFKQIYKSESETSTPEETEQTATEVTTETEGSTETASENDEHSMVDIGEDGKFKSNDNKNKVTQQSKFEAAKEYDSKTGSSTASSDSDNVPDTLGLSDKIEYKAVVNRINQVYNDEYNNSAEFELVDTPHAEDMDSEGNPLSSDGSLIYIVKYNYDYWYILYYPREDGATSLQDTTGTLASEYLSPEEFNNDTEVDW